MKKIKVGIIGTGFIGPVHIETLRRINFIEIVALADIDDERAKEKAEAFEINDSYGNYEDLLAREDIEAVHICTPNFLHYPMVKKALLAGKHVLCEKPLAVSVDEARELVEIANEKKLANIVDFNLRYYPLVQHAREMIKSGELGKVLAVNGSYKQDWLLYPTDYNWRVDPAKSGKARAVADIGSHWLDMVQYVTCANISEVMADFATFYPVRKRPKKAQTTYQGKIIKEEDYEDVNVTTEDYATILMHFDQGAHGSMTVNQMAAGRKNRLYFEIHGSKKSLAWSSEKPNELWVGNRDKANETVLKDPALVYENVRNYIDFPGGHNEGFPETTKQLFKAFYTHIRQNSFKEDVGDELPTFKTGLLEMTLSESIYDSAHSGKWVKI